MKGLISTELTLKGVAVADEDEKVGEGQVVGRPWTARLEEVMLYRAGTGSPRGFLERRL